VVNLPPYFATSLTGDIFINGGVIKTYALPAVVDPEGLPVTITPKWNGGGLPLFIVYGTGGFSIEPKKQGNQGTYQIDIELFDGFNVVVVGSFKIFVNSIPFFSTALLDQTVTLNTISHYTLPSHIDLDGSSSSQLTI
jgi:hypothetical protein